MKGVAEGKDPEATEVATLAEGTPIWVDADADADLDHALELMAEHRVRRLPVIEDHKPVGIISQADIARQVSVQESGGLLASISAGPANN